jgi:CRP-like cAMP-binding protein
MEPLTNRAPLPQSVKSLTDLVQPFAARLTVVPLADSSKPPLNLRDLPPGTQVNQITADALIILERGEAHLYSADRPGVAVRRIRPGDIFGITECFCGVPIDYNIVTLSECRVGTLSTSQFKQFIRSDADVRRGLIDALGHRTQELYRLARELP